ncbi:MAG TPA: Sb-PDE family phosphodiesterase [Melioribacteraceae bacterium]|nr:Sb-PDE family phosphodiesterase [Melioribacteraceae bacterium]
MKIKHLLTAALFVFFFTSLSAQPNYRKEIKIPDIPGYKSLKCDFHSHTVFSDGTVWPTFRIEEAWRSGLDAIAITDHIEYQPHKDYVPTNHNAAYEIGNALADQLGIILIHGSEITRSMPPGHLNAIFITDANALVKDDWRDAIKEAVKQGGLVFWNHPGWTGQQPDGVARWYDEHTYLLENKLISGIEVVNSIEYYPTVFEWCLEKKLAILGNSDIHNPIEFDYVNTRRPVTLVFAKTASSEGIKDGIMNRRTAIFYDGKLYGEEKYLDPLFRSSVKFETTTVNTVGRSTANIKVTNNSDIDFELRLEGTDEKIRFPEYIKLLAGTTMMFPVRARKDDTDVKKKYSVVYAVENLITGAEKNLKLNLDFNIKVTPKK